MNESDYSEFVEVDPTGRYGRYSEILGKGASKTVYRAFDEYEGIEVAWNQVKLYDFLQSPEDLERLYCEIHLLKTLNHPNIMKFYTSWVDTTKRNINFVTEMFTSGTLRQYRLKHKRVNIRAIKHWCRQILNGLLYLHSHDPPIIHRDLKCDNIFVNGNQGVVKIGDLGLAAIRRKSHVEHCVGTPEFMAPEVYLEEYNELVDIYSFGMCILEMVTFEYPYSECTHPAQIYKKVISGKKPDVLYKVKDPEVRQFIEKCLATVSVRLSARELLNDPFLQIDKCESEMRMTICREELHYVDPLLRQPFLELDYEGKSFGDSSYNGHSNGYALDDQNGWACHPDEFEQSGIELFEIHEDEHDEHYADLDITIKGKRREDGSIFLRLRISDKEGRIRNIYFPFDIEMDTALSVATEMVAELDITDQDVTNIADMIDGEITLLVPEWKSGPGIEETPRFANSSFCHNCASNNTSTGSFMNFLSDNGGGDLQVSQCLGNGCSASHGRFEEITYQVDSSPNHASGFANNLVLSSVSHGFHHPEIWDRIESLECSSHGSAESQSLEEYEKSDHKTSAKETKEFGLEKENSSSTRKYTKSLSGTHSLTTIAAKLSSDFSMDYERIQQELRWLKATSKMKLREFREKHLGFVRRSGKPPLNYANTTQKIKNAISSYETLQESSDCHDKNSCDLEGNVSGRYLVTNKNFYRNKLLSSTHRRTTSLPIDAVDL